MSQLFGRSSAADNGGYVDWNRYKGTDYWNDLFDQYGLNFGVAQRRSLTCWVPTQWSGGTPQLAAYRTDIGWARIVAPSMTGASPRKQISGITRDRTGAALGDVTVKAFLSADPADGVRTADYLEATVTSAADGAYNIGVRDDNGYYLVAYKSGSPDVSGTTANNITGT